MLPPDKTLHDDENGDDTLVCPMCAGDGELWDYDAFYKYVDDPYVITDCPVCEGTGFHPDDPRPQGTFQ